MNLNPASAGKHYHASVYQQTGKPYGEGFFKKNERTKYKKRSSSPASHKTSADRCFLPDLAGLSTILLRRT